MTLTFDITQDDIDRGWRTVPWACALAKALKRQGHQKVWVGVDEMRLGAQRYTFPITGPLADFRRRFDQSRRLVQPCSMTVRLQPV